MVDAGSIQQKIEGSLLEVSSENIKTTTSNIKMMIKERTECVDIWSKKKCKKKAKKDLSGCKITKTKNSCKKTCGDCGSKFFSIVYTLVDMYRPGKMTTNSY